MDAVAAHKLDAKHVELILDALKQAMLQSGEQRLFQSGKLAGLFPSRSGAGGEAALQALTDGLLETVRTENKGRHIVEWVRTTPKGIAFIHERDTPKATLRELRDVIGSTRDAVPSWMAEARDDVQALAERFERHAEAMLQRLDALSERVESALRRAEVEFPHHAEALPVAWGIAALEYLDQRVEAGASSVCPLEELFHAVRQTHPELTMPDYQQGLQRLHDLRALQLQESHTGESSNPEFALLHGKRICSYVIR